MEKFWSVNTSLNNQIQYREWKVKDRLALKKLTLDNPMGDNLNDEYARESLKILVLNCLDKEYSLSSDELKYLLIHIRSKSINSPLQLECKCNQCEVKEIKNINLDDIKIKKSDYKSFKDIEITEPKNISFYNQKILESRNEIFDDLILRIKTLNGEVKKYEELVNFFENLTTNEYDELISEFENMRFKILPFEIECNNCKSKNLFTVDDIIDLIPLNWILR